MSDPVAIAVLFPDLLGTYGDGGNAVILAQRLRWRGFEAEIVEVDAGAAIPESCDCYVLGGGEDAPQTLAADRLIASGTLARAVDLGAAVLAVCAGLQVIGESFLAPDGRSRPGAAVIDCSTRRTATRRAVGELL